MVLSVIPLSRAWLLTNAMLVGVAGLEPARARV
jgi:hypothetical protein